MSAECVACVRVRASNEGWFIDEFLSSKPGTGQGQKLVKEIADPLLAEADLKKIPIRLVAANEKLAKYYKGMFPDLERMESAKCSIKVKLGGVLMERKPKSKQSSKNENGGDNPQTVTNGEK